MVWLEDPPLLLFRGIGGPEIAIVGVVLLLIFGAARLPKIGSSLGQSLRAFKNSVTGQDEAETEVDEPREKMVKSSAKDEGKS